MTGLSGILYGGLVWDLMTIDNLIEFWADWSARRDDGGLGYGGSRFNRLMAGETLMPAADAASQLPYGVDGDAAASLIGPAAVCDAGTDAAGGVGGIPRGRPAGGQGGVSG